MPRTTLAAPATIDGITLFSATTARLRIRPPAPGEPPGLHFARADRGGLLFPAHVAHLMPEPRHTVLALDPGDRAGPRVALTEHVLAALTGLGVTDAILELDGPEVPVGDGSALHIVEAVGRAGLVPLAGEPATIGPASAWRLERGEATLTAEPAPEPGVLELEYTLDYGPGSGLAPQTAAWRTRWDEPDGSFAALIAPARTFCLEAEALALRAAGLFAHVGPEQMLVLGAGGRPIQNRLRFEDEPARHKLLDLLGDLALTGGRVTGRFVGVRTGHTDNHRLARALHVGSPG